MASGLFFICFLTFFGENVRKATFIIAVGMNAQTSEKGKEKA
jgi:hypothetical protein